ncbi:unnamed protein product [Urochloa humidicola]
MVITSEILEMVGNISPDVDHNCVVLIAKPMETVGRGVFFTNGVKAHEPGENMNANLHGLAIFSLEQVTGSKNEINRAGNWKLEKLTSTIQESTSDYDKEMLEELLAKDHGGIGAVNIGGGDGDGTVEMDKITDALNAAKAGVEKGIVPGGGARLADPCLLFNSRIASIHHSSSTKFWQAQTALARTTRGFHTSGILDSTSVAESPRAGPNPHPHLVTFDNAINYFERGRSPALVVHVPDTNDDLYKLVRYNPQEPLMLTEMGKISSRSLVEAVTSLHDHNLCLPHRVGLGDLSVSSVGTFKLPKMELVQLTEQRRSDDLACVSGVLEEMMRARHRDRVIQNLPPNYSDLLVGMKLPTTTVKWIKWHPSHLPATTYALAFMKLHGLLMENGLRTTDCTLAEDIMMALPYQVGQSMLAGMPKRSVWTDVARNNRLLTAWFNYRTYTSANPFDIMEFGRNVITGHPLDHRRKAAAFLPKGSSPYSEEAVSVMFQHSFPLLMPGLLQEVLNRVQKLPPGCIDRLHLEQLFPGVPPYYLLEQ